MIKEVLAYVGAALILLNFCRLAAFIFNQVMKISEGPKHIDRLFELVAKNDKAQNTLCHYLSLRIQKLESQNDKKSGKF